MIPSNDASGNAGSATGHLFVDAFIRNAHRILFGGYHRLDAPAYQSSEEDEITGDLAREMMNCIAGSSEPWMQYCQVHDQHPVTAQCGPRAARRVGKRRPKIDLQFVANNGGGFLRFSWEAKRLGRGHGLSAYFGPAGLGCFLSGQYASDCGFGGMIGYVQHGELNAWKLDIRARLESEFDQAGTTPDSSRIVQLGSLHARPELGKRIAIHHTLLLFGGNEDASNSHRAIQPGKRTISSRLNSEPRGV